MVCSSFCKIQTSPIARVLMEFSSTEGEIEVLNWSLSVQETYPKIKINGRILRIFKPLIGLLVYKSLLMQS
jgi:hypothetical protein